MTAALLLALAALLTPNEPRRHRWVGIHPTSRCLDCGATMEDAAKGRMCAGRVDVRQ